MKCKACMGEIGGVNIVKTLNIPLASHMKWAQWSRVLEEE